MSAAGQSHGPNHIRTHRPTHSGNHDRTQGQPAGQDRGQDPGQPPGDTPDQTPGQIPGQTPDQKSDQIAAAPLWLAGRGAFRRPRHIRDAACLPDLPLLFWLVEQLQPARVVQLGLSSPQSYLSLCQALERLGGGTSTLGIALAPPERPTEHPPEHSRELPAAAGHSAASHNPASHSPGGHRPEARSPEGGKAGPHTTSAQSTDSHGTAAHSTGSHSAGPDSTDGLSAALPASAQTWPPRAGDAASEAAQSGLARAGGDAVFAPQVAGDWLDQHEFLYGDFSRLLAVPGHAPGASQVAEPCPGESDDLTRLLAQELADMPVDLLVIDAPPCAALSRALAHSLLPHLSDRAVVLIWPAPGPAPGPGQDKGASGTGRGGESVLARYFPGALPRPFRQLPLPGRPARDSALVHSQTDQGLTGQGWAGQAHTDQGPEGRGPADRDDTDPGGAVHAGAAQHLTRPGQADLVQVCPGQAGQAHGGPGQAGAGQPCMGQPGMDQLCPGQMGAYQEPPDPAAGSWLPAGQMTDHRAARTLAQAAASPADHRTASPATGTAEQTVRQTVNQPAGHTADHTADHPADHTADHPGGQAAPRRAAQTPPPRPADPPGIFLAGAQPPAALAQLAALPSGHPAVLALQQVFARLGEGLLASRLATHLATQLDSQRASQRATQLTSPQQAQLTQQQAQLAGLQRQLAEAAPLSQQLESVRAALSAAEAGEAAAVAAAAGLRAGLFDRDQRIAALEQELAAVSAQLEEQRSLADQHQAALAALAASQDGARRREAELSRQNLQQTGEIARLTEQMTGRLRDAEAARDSSSALRARIGQQEQELERMRLRLAEAQDRRLTLWEAHEQLKAAQAARGGRG